MSEAIETVRSGLPTLNLSDEELVEMAVQMRQQLLTETDPKTLLAARHANRLFAELLREHRRALRVQNEYVENTLRLERQFGALLARTLKPGVAKQGTKKEMTLEEAGISAARSQDWQQLARIEQAEFDAYIEKVKSEDRHLTQIELVRLGATLKRRLTPPLVRAPRPSAVPDQVVAGLGVGEEPRTEQPEPDSWWSLGRHLLFCGAPDHPQFIEMAEAVKPAFAFSRVEEGFEHDWLLDLIDGVIALNLPLPALQNFFLQADMPYRRVHVYHLLDRDRAVFAEWPPAALALIFSRGSAELKQTRHGFAEIVVTPDDRERGEDSPPLGLIQHLMLDYTGPGEMVLDPLGGAGATLLAAHEIGRNCLMAEAHLEKAEQIMQRWERAALGRAKRVR